MKYSEIIKKIACVIITSDKCYYPKKNKSYFSENDHLGGEDPYSASKACAEIIYKSFQETYLNKKKILQPALLELEMLLGEVIGLETE